MITQRTQSRWKPWSMAIVVGLTLAATTAGPVWAARSAVVDIEEFRFTPATLTVPVGTAVTWTNHDEEVHTVTSATGRFRSTGLGREETFARNFMRPGRYEYFCALHPHMKATVIVK